MKTILIIFLIIIIVLFILVILRSLYECNNISVTDYIIDVPNLTKDHSFAFIADIHSKQFKSNKLIDRLKALDVKEVIIGGDMIVGKAINNDNGKECLEQLISNFKVYYVYGNHETRIIDRKIPDISGFLPFVEKQERDGRLTLLNNKCITLFEDKEINGEQKNKSSKATTIKLWGLELGDEFYHKKRPKKLEVKDVKGKLKGIDEGGDDIYNILICHKPDYFFTYAQSGANLVLAGHNHGGIVRIPILGGIISTSFKLFPKYSAGLYVESESKMILTRGIGTHTINFRLFNKPEIVRVKLQCDANTN